MPNAVSSTLIDSATQNGDAAVQHGLPAGVRPNGFRLFYLTRYYPHKNLELLLELFSSNDPKLHDVVLYITISAEHHPGARRLLDAITARGLQRQIVNLGPLPQEELGSYYRCMHALVMPTTLESFSGTYLEAMTFGCPILTSDLDFAREICANAALYFDPLSSASLREAILQLRRDKALAKSLVEQGRTLVQRERGSWDDNGRALTALIRARLQCESDAEPSTTCNAGFTIHP